MEMQPNAALRGQTTGARAREGEEHEKKDAPRRQNAPHPGERPGILAEPGPQSSDRSPRHSSGNARLLVVATLAAAAADGVPHSPRAGAQEEGRAGGEGEGEYGTNGEGEGKAKAKKTLRHFSGRVFMLPDAQGLQQWFLH